MKTRLDKEIAPKRGEEDDPMRNKLGIRPLMVNFF